MKKISAYEENFTLHAENARLRRLIETYEQERGFHLIRKKCEERIRKAEYALKRAQKERDRYHDLWREEVHKNRFSSDFDQEVVIARLEADIQELKENLLGLQQENAFLKVQVDELTGTIFLTEDDDWDGDEPEEGFYIDLFQ